MKPQRIAYVINVFPKLSETFIAGEVAELRRRNIECLILSLRKPTEELRHEMIAQTGLDKIAFYDASQFSEILARFRPQLIHAHFATEPTAAARALATGLAVPYTFTAHGYDVRRKPPADFFDRANAAAVVITVSQANASYISNTFGVPPGKIRVIPCGVDTDVFRPDPNSRKAAAEPLMVCVARHVAVKNLSMLLHVCAALRDRGVRFRCLMIGDGPFNQELKQLRASLQLEHIVEMPGAANQEEVLRCWQRADVGVLTSENEGMPVCLMEAAACAVPVIATAVGGIPELVQHGHTGLLVPLNDVPSFAAAAERFLLNPTEAKKVGVAAREHAEQNFSIKQQVDSLLHAWSEILA